MNGHIARKVAARRGAGAKYPSQDRLALVSPMADHPRPLLVEGAPVSDSGSSGLLDQARLARAEAARARRLGTQQPDHDTRITLTRFADEMEQRALALEQQAFNVPPAPRRHATPQQMQQAQATAANPDESHETPHIAD